MTKTDLQLSTDMSFYTVRERLALLPEHRGGRNAAAEAFLSLLKKGELKAVAEYGSKIVQRLLVPRNFWRGVNNAEFRDALRIKRANGWNGVYLVEQKALFEAYLEEAFKRQPENLQQDVLQVTTSLSDNTEVIIEQSEWHRFLERNGIEDPRPALETAEHKTVDRQGRREHESWKPLMPLIVAEFQKPDWRTVGGAGITEAVYAAAQSLPGTLIKKNTLNQEINKIINSLPRETD